MQTCVLCDASAEVLI